MFIQDAWYIAGFVKDFDSEKPAQRWIIGKPLVLFRQKNGSLVALSDRCPHRQAPLSQGKIIDDSVACPYHGHRYGADGACVHMPFNNDRIPTSASVPTYAVIEKYGFAWVWMGDADKADESQFPEKFEALDNSDFTWVPFKDEADADYQLLNDNILDLTHVPFLHSIIGDSPLEDMDLQIEHGERTVSVQRDSQIVRPGDFMLSQGMAEKVKITGKWLFSLPCYAAGNIYYYDVAKPDSGSVMEWDVRLAHIPTVPGKCIIYGVIGADFLPKTDATREFLRKTFHTTLKEDKGMCEDIQTLIDSEPNFRQFSVKTDAGGVYARRMIEQLAS